MSSFLFGFRRCVRILSPSALPLLGALIFSLVFGSLAYSQTNLGRVSGTITDQTGGAVAGATVTVLDVERGVTRTLTTDGAGAYNAPNLTPGTYTVRAQANGFQTIDRQNIALGVGQELAVDLVLQPGEQTQTITVTEALPMVNTTNATVTSTIENQDISNLPINGRNFQSLTDLRPGIQTQRGGGTNARSSNGQPPEDNIFMFDGLFNKGTYGGNSVVGGGNLAGEAATVVPLDAIQEVTFVENPKAEYGWGTGAVVNIGFKAGTNSLHGTAYAYGRSDAFDAKSAFAVKKPGTALEQFGGSVGGPIKKDKIFFFGAYEGKRVVSSTTQIDTEPTVASLPTNGTTCSQSLVGDCTNSFPNAIADITAKIGASHPNYPGTTTPVALSPLSLAIAGCTVGGTCTQSAGLFNNGGTTTSETNQIPNSQHTDNHIEKIDYHISDRNTLNGEYFFGTGNTYSTQGTPAEPWWGATTPVRGQGFTIVDAWLPNSTWVNEARFGYHRYNQIIGFGECADNGRPAANGTASAKSTYGQQYGSPDYPAVFGLVTGTPYSCAFPALTISGGFSQLGNLLRGYEPRLENAWKASDSISYTRGKHLLKFGGDFRRSTVVGGAFGSGQGSVTFGTAGVAPAFTGATPVEDFLTGYPGSEQLLIGSPVRNALQYFWAGFVQDDWRVVPRLTANLGLRWEYTGPVREQNNLFGNFDPTAATGMVQQSPGGSIWKPQYTNFGPRVGFSWDVKGNGSTVVRAGAGVMYVYVVVQTYINAVQPNADPTGFALYGTAGNQIQAANSNGIQTAVVTSSPVTTAGAGAPLPWAQNTPIFNATSTSALACGEGSASGAVKPVGLNFEPPQCNIGAVAPNFRRPYVTAWDLSIQHQFTNNLALDVEYVGNHGTEMPGAININQAALGSSGAANEIPREPFYLGGQNTFGVAFPYMGKITLYENIGKSNYDALQTTLTERVSHGVSFVASYVLAHALASNDSVLATLPENSLNYNGDYGPTAYDARNRFTLTASWAVPGHKAPGQLLNGWAVNSVIYLLGKVPFNAIDSTNDISGTGNLNDRWTLTGSPSDIAPGVGAGAVPCFGVAGSSFAKAAGCTTVAAMPTACLNAAAAEPISPVGTGVPTTSAVPVAGAPSTPQNTGTFNLYKFGCYMQGSAVIVPPAQGTFGNMTRNVLRSFGLHQWDLSVTKDWKFRERYGAQFRTEIFNVLNTVQYANPQLNLAAPATFGQSQALVNQGGIAIAQGSPREIQFALKLSF